MQQSGPGVPTDPASNTGSVTFQLVWQQPSLGAKALFAPPFNACVDHGISTIVAVISDGTATVTNSWPCSAHEGFISGVPAGTNYTLVISGISSGPTPTTTWIGSSSPITVTAGQVANVGAVVMGYIGGDTTQPTVTNIIPYTWNFGNGSTTVPVTDRFIVAFSKPMAISTIMTPNMTLKLIDNTSISASLIYNGINNTVEIIPSAPLANNTQYVLQVISCLTATSCILDTTGYPLQLSNYTNIFMTDPAPVGVPDAPSGITAAPGNGQVKLDWLAVSGATSYNVRYGLSSGIYDRQILDVRAPFIHLGLANSQTYHYIVTAVNSFGESLFSAEAIATPIFPSGNPLPPASLTVVSVSGQNTLAWDAVAGATAYNLYWSNTPITPDRNAADNVIRGVTSPHIHTGLSDGLPYCYIVTALNSNGESADSIQVCGGSGAIHIVW